MTLSKTRVRKEIQRVFAFRKKHDSDDNRYFLGYEDALRWVASKMDVQK